jgi:diadenosine tetraphosphatase ApaH/serine/threonine PP2A family protein phosphatase
VPLAQASLRWTRTVLDADARAFLADLPLEAREGDVELHHGSVGDPQQYVITTAQAIACLRDLERVAPGTEVLILGHTHRPMAVSAAGGALLRGSTGTVGVPRGQPIVLNPGAVGQSRSRDPRARVAVLDTEARVATFHALRYDVAGCRRALRDRGLPPESCHVPRARWGDVASAVRSRVGRLVAR